MPEPEVRRQPLKSSNITLIILKVAGRVRGLGTRTRVPASPTAAGTINSPPPSSSGPGRRGSLSSVDMWSMITVLLLALHSKNISLMKLSFTIL